jgi:hypothetical protein
VWIVLMPLTLWLGEMMESPTWGFLDWILGMLAWAIPGVVIANGYEREALYRLIPGKRRFER